MNDMIINAAQDPSCILAVTPDRGGSWWAALRPGGNYPWPSSTPRNFAEEPTAFYDCQSICSEKIDPSHDYRFLFDSEIVSDKIECSMFYAGAAGFPFGIYCHPTNQINCFTNMFRVSSSPSSQYANTSVYNGDPSRLQGRHVIEMEIAGNSLKTYLDGVLINRPSGFVRTGVATCDLPQCNSGYVYKIQIKDLTTGRTVWSYPSEAERVRLLTKTNVRTDRGVFEAADTTKSAAISTQLTDPPQTFLVFDDNGQMINSATMPGGVFTISDGKKIRALLGFDRALTAAEIAAFGVRRPRNFAEKPMTWTEFSPDNIDINTQHDYEFLIQFSSNGQLPPTDIETQLFYSTDNKMLAGVWIAKDGQIRGYLSVYEYNALMIHEIGEPALSAGIHTIRILAVGNTMSAYLDDELMNSAVRNRRTDFSEITSYPISSFDGNILYAKLTDLTTGETVWQANHNDLFTY